ncbi:phosphatidate cytidylyltransferase, mitochondrial-like [Paramacrobiotus metropolitanus]|uniref:phosphatidate cytidylyltransferase, mitochondrial-like n=1 Tax=Paramacrobiotus metropolitanus TaxID=2943436 RepID=UPI0024456B21|nr:phosphatidate cytidylyltransferase, mitochondrial-like [Paramacrobiotus metropolitanus]
MAYFRAAENSIHRGFLTSLPSPVKYMFAYGSGVFRQQGHASDKANMLDYIVVVDDPLQWHTENLVKHSRHYSFLRFGGPKFLTEIQRGFGAGVYFNTLVKFEDRLVKYGVVATDDLLADLRDWTTLYISGRLHKPVLTVQDTADSSFRQAMLDNLRSAVRTASLLLPDAFTDEELFLRIANLSYAGDFRMIFGEDKNKVRNIVLPHLDKFHEIYRPILKEEQYIDASANYRTFQQDCSPKTKLLLLGLLPRNLKERVIRDRFRDNRNKDVSIILEDLAHSADCSKIVDKGCRQIVSYSSWWQSVKGIFTAGIIKSVRYSATKVIKMIKGGMKKGS